MPRLLCHVGSFFFLTSLNFFLNRLRPWISCGYRGLTVSTWEKGWHSERGNKSSYTLDPRVRGFFSLIQYPAIGGMQMDQWWRKSHIPTKLQWLPQQMPQSDYLHTPPGNVDISWPFPQKALFHPTGQNLCHKEGWEPEDRVCLLIQEQQMTGPGCD